MSNGQIDTPEGLPWIGVVLTMGAGTLGWLSLLWPDLLMLATIAVLTASGAIFITTLVATGQTRAMLGFRMLLAVAGLATFLSIAGVRDDVNRHIAWGLLGTVYLVLLSAGNPWGTSPVFLLLTTVAATGASAGFWAEPDGAPRLHAALSTLLWCVPAGLGVGLLTGFFQRRRQRRR